MTSDRASKSPHKSDQRLGEQVVEHTLSAVLLKALVAIYLEQPCDVARVCDETDPRGALLGLVRNEVWKRAEHVDLEGPA